ncbi:hypothetical protein BGX31_002828 [Mortierella sp. GBA43]|nr:hypothetical protein BGX31_002828 [Mortierella sp. GBA43]
MSQGSQDIRLKEAVKRVPVRQGSDGRPYVLVEDIHGAFFPHGDELQLNGEHVPFPNLLPKGIASYPDQALTVVSTPRSLADSNEPSDMVIVDSNHRDSVLIMRTLNQLQSQVSRLERHLQESDSKLAALYELEKSNTEVQHQILSKVDLMLVKTERLLTQTFELHEYTLPRLFIVLPDVAYQGLNPAHILSRYAQIKFRLFFLCECGTHTRPLGPHRLNHIHIARHEGYEISQPKEFFRKYGPHVLRLLEALRIGIKLASGIVLPALSTLSAMDLPEHLVNDLNHKVMSCITYLTAFQNSIDDHMPRLENGMDEQPQLVLMDNGEDCNVKETDMEIWSEDIFQIEGADLRRLGSFLKRKDQDRVFGNLFRTVDQQGHVKWICMDHYRSTYHLRQDHDFENEVKLFGGEYDKQLGIVRVNLTSSEAIEPFLGAMTRAGAFNELDLHMRHYAYQDLKTLGEALSKSNASKLTFSGHDYRELASMGKKKLYAILKIMAAGKVRYFHFKYIRELIPARGVIIPKDLSTVRSLELTGITLKEGHETFGTLLAACTHLAVLRMANTPLKPTHLISVINGLAKAHQTLTTVAFVNCGIEKAEAYKIAALVEPLESLRDLDLGQNFLGDSGCSAIIEAAGNKLERLSMPYTGFGDESAMALERAVDGERLKYLDISASTDVLGPEATRSIIRLMGRLRHATELMFPRSLEPADETCAKIIRGLDTAKLERLEMERSDGGDHTALALARMLSDPVHPWTVLTTLKLELPSITLAGAETLGEALPRDCPVVKVSFSGSRMFQHAPVDLSLFKRLFTNLCSQLCILKLRNTCMSDEVASALCEVLQAPDSTCRLEYLDLAENKLTPAGGAMVLKSLQENRSLRTLRMESHSFAVLGSIGVAVQRFLENNRTLQRLTISHVNLKELTAGLSGNGAILKAIELQYVDGQVDDILALGNFLKSTQNTLLRLWIKRARVCDEDRSLDYLAHALKQNTTIVDLEWEYDQGYEADSHVLQRYLDRNRELLRKSGSVGSKAQDLLALAGLDPWTICAISQGVE